MNQAGTVKIKVNGQKIPLNKFATSVIKNVIVGLVSSLKTESEPEKIEIEINLVDTNKNIAPRIY